MKMVAQFSLQDPACLIMEKLSFFYDHAMFFMLLILSIVTYSSFFIIKSKVINLKLLYNESVEVVWTILPGVVLMFIAFPSLKTLYLLEDVSNPSMTLKVVGHQWFWSYELSDFSDISFDSYMSKLEGGDFLRFLDVDNRVCIPINCTIRVILTSDDVIHSWSLPSLGVKLDANPGRLNQTSLSSSFLGLFFGQCSEICGVLHSFMPICLEVLSMKDFLKFLNSN